MKTKNVIVIATGKKKNNRTVTRVGTPPPSGYVLDGIRRDRRYGTLCLTYQLTHQLLGVYKKEIRFQKGVRDAVVRGQEGYGGNGKKLVQGIRKSVMEEEGYSNRVA